MTFNGIHHVTAIAGAAAHNRSFYVDVLGLRLVKRTVNFDDPGTWHLYFGDNAGAPGSLITFFPWPHATRGRAGVGDVLRTTFRVPAGSIGFWAHRFVEKGVRHDGVARRFGDSVIDFEDPDGALLSLVAIGDAPASAGTAGATGGGVPEANAITGIDGVTLLLREAGPTAAILTSVFGFQESGREGAVTRLALGDGAGRSVVDLHVAGNFPGGRLGRGSVHHVAFRAASDAEQAELAARLVRDHGLRPTEQRDRQYFRSIYFREPGGVLFEIATDDPGFAVDEPLAHLGEQLKLPPQYEAHRAQIEATLPSLED
ncbi:diguanylate cyclase [Camelimonas fluminis]|uniref:Ring-cleaving dioxygenase n=1 Tax=Camelimonas fluminis TaxID=1576911 RepID=A0ABV7UKK5_9HYPH|nr:ring-cleaving dioxygenase [Camelimonas fluminis]GHE54094.1 diguanylate cyclase [Camelimonas fluminis]